MWRRHRTNPKDFEEQFEKLRDSLARGQRVYRLRKRIKKNPMEKNTKISNKIYEFKHELYKCLTCFKSLRSHERCGSCTMLVHGQYECSCAKTFTPRNSFSFEEGIRG